MQDILRLRAGWALPLRGLWCLRNSLRKFQGDQLGVLLAHVGDGVSVAAFSPRYVSGFEFHLRRGLAFNVAAQIEISQGYHEVGTVVMVFGYDSAGLQFQVGGADAVLYEEDLLGAAIQDVQASLFVPLMRHLRFIVSHEFDGHDSESLVGEILRGVGEVAGHEEGFAIAKGAQGGRLSDDIVFDVRFSEGGEEIVVPVGVNDHGRVGRKLHFEDADEFVFEHQVMVGLRCDLDNGGCALRGGEECEGEQGKEKPAWFHRAKF
jgi:hypothetical protein